MIWTKRVKLLEPHRGLNAASKRYAGLFEMTSNVFPGGLRRLVVYMGHSRFASRLWLLPDEVSDGSGSRIHGQP